MYLVLHVVASRCSYVILTFRWWPQCKVYLYIYAFHMQKRSYDTFKLNNTLLFYSGSFSVRPHKLHVKYTIFYKGIPYFIFPEHWETGTKQSHTRNMRELKSLKSVLLQSHQRIIKDSTGASTELHWCRTGMKIKLKPFILKSHSRDSSVWRILNPNDLICYTFTSQGLIRLFQGDSFTQLGMFQSDLPKYNKTVNMPHYL